MKNEKNTVLSQQVKKNIEKTIETDAKPLSLTLIYMTSHFPDLVFTLFKLLSLEVTTLAFFHRNMSSTILNFYDQISFFFTTHCINCKSGCVLLHYNLSCIQYRAGLCDFHRFFSALSSFFFSPLFFYCFSWIFQCFIKFLFFSFFYCFSWIFQCLISFFFSLFFLNVFRGFCSFLFKIFMF